MVELTDSFSAVKALTRFTNSAPAAVILMAACFRQMRYGEGAYFQWAEKEITLDLGINRRAILTARRQLQRMKLIDWDAPAGQRAVYVVNTALVSEILGGPIPPDDTADPARNAPPRSAPPRSARGPHSIPPAEVTDPARSAPPSPAEAPATPQHPARFAPPDVPAYPPDPARLASNVAGDPPADPTDPARNARLAVDDLSSKVETAPADPQTLARIARPNLETAPAEPVSPARSARGDKGDLPANHEDCARPTLDTAPEAPADPPNPARSASPLAPPGPPRTPPGTRYSSFSSTYTQYASAAPAQGDQPAKDFLTSDAGAAPAQAPPVSPDSKTADQADSAAAALLKRCGLTAAQISAAIQKYTAEQITQAVDRVRELLRAGRCHKPVAMLVWLLKTGDWPAPVDTSAFDEPPSAPVHPTRPGQPYLPPMRHWQTMQEREAEIAACRQSRPPIDGFFAAILGRTVAPAVSAGIPKDSRPERSALCAAS